MTKRTGSSCAMWRGGSLGLVMALGMMMVGCGGAGGPGGGLGLSGALSPASGVATFDGKPVENLSLQLVPVDHNTGEGLIATTGPEGRFELGTTDGRKGGQPGRYKVTILPSFQVDKAISSRIPDSYKDPTLTNLIVEIPQGGSSDLKIDFQSSATTRSNR